MRGPSGARVFGVIHRVLNDHLQIVDRVSNGQPLAVGHGLRDDSACGDSIYSGTALGSHNSFNLPSGISLKILITPVESRKRPKVAMFNFASSRDGFSQ